MLAVLFWLQAPGCHALVQWQEPETKAKLLPYTKLAGEPSFATFCMPFFSKRVVLVTTNMEYYDLFLNWYHYAKPFLTSHDQLVVAAEDPMVEVELLKNSSWAVIDFNGYLHEAGGVRGRLAKSARSGPPFGTQGFSDLVSNRPRYLSYFVEKGCTVLYSDVDNVWKSNVFAELDKAGAHDLYITDDSCKNLGFERFNFCTCFMYWQPTPGNRDLASGWDGRLIGGNNQAPFNAELKMNKDHLGTVDFAVLPFKNFPPGCKGDDFFSDAAVLHANCMVGRSTKVRFLARHGLWQFAVPPADEGA